MLSSADARVVKRDPQVPGLGTLLSPEAFAEALRRSYPDGGVTCVEARYVRYKRGTSCLVGYRVDTTHGPLDAYARAHNPRHHDKIENARRGPSTRSPLGSGIAVLSDLSVVIYPFPNDHELRGLHGLADSGPRRALLERLLPDHPDLWAATVEPLRYKPERRFVARLLTPTDPGAVLKLYTKDDFRIASKNLESFVNEAPLRIARRLGRSRRDRATAVEWLDGRPLRQALMHEGASGQTCRSVGAALARLHAQKPKLRRSSTAESYACSLADAAAAIAEIAPEIAERARRLAERIGERLLNRHFRARRAIHGDFCADQVLLMGGDVAIVDFDRTGYGDPRIDLGTFQARLVYDAIRGVLSPDAARTCFDDVLQGYRETSDKDVTRKLPRFTAASLLLLAVEPFRHRHPDWPGESEAVVAAAEAQFAARGDEGGS